MILAVGCAAPVPEAPPVTLAEAAEDTVFASVEALGPFTLESNARRVLSAEGVQPRISVDATQLKWKDADHWALSRSRDGRPADDIVVYGAVAWVGAHGERLVRKGDAEPWRASLAQAWDPWALGLENVRGQIGLTGGVVEEQEGRRVVKHALTLLAPGAKARRTWVASVVEGNAWIDEKTAVRTAAEVHVVARSRDETLDLTLSFRFTGIGHELFIDPPMVSSAVAPELPSP